MVTSPGVVRREWSANKAGDGASNGASDATYGATAAAVAAAGGATDNAAHGATSLLNSATNCAGHRLGGCGGATSRGLLGSGASRAGLGCASYSAGGGGQGISGQEGDVVVGCQLLHSLGGVVDQCLGLRGELDRWADAVAAACEQGGARRWAGEGGSWDRCVGSRKGSGWTHESNRSFRKARAGHANTRARAAC